jgi:hypothetical protein
LAQQAGTFFHRKTLFLQKNVFPLILYGGKHFFRLKQRRKKVFLQNNFFSAEKVPHQIQRISLRASHPEGTVLYGNTELVRSIVFVLPPLIIDPLCGARSACSCSPSIGFGGLFWAIHAGTGRIYGISTSMGASFTK